MEMRPRLRWRAMHAGNGPVSSAAAVLHRMLVTSCHPSKLAALLRAVGRSLHRAPRARLGQSWRHRPRAAHGPDRRRRAQRVRRHSHHRAGSTNSWRRAWRDRDDQPPRVVWHLELDPVAPCTGRKNRPAQAVRDGWHDRFPRRSRVLSRQRSGSDRRAPTDLLTVPRDTAAQADHHGRRRWK
jgi:hypothetical protein